MKVDVTDPMGARFDADLPFVARALDPTVAAPALQRALRADAPDLATARLESIAVVRWKPGRRCLVAYRIIGDDPGANATILAKLRARGADHRTDDLQRWLWSHGFGPESADGISVARPLGTASEIGATLQRQEPGEDVAARLGRGPALAAEAATRAADAIAKFHRSGAPLARVHRIVDELSILRQRLTDARARRADLALRIDRVRAKCETIATRLPVLRGLVPVHRDFYAEHVLLAPGRDTLLDLDQCCLGDPWLDAGNFVAHLTELAMRTTNDHTAFAAAEAAFASRCAERAGDDPREELALRTYVTLTLARHIELSTRLPGRAHTTAPLVERCEERLGLATRGGPSARAPRRRATAAAKALGVALALCAATSLGAQTPNASRLSVELRQYGVYDSNIDRDALPLPAYGGVLGTAVRVVDRPQRPRFDAGVEVGVHRFTQTDVWDRTSVYADASFEHRLARWLILESKGVGSFKGSNEDRELGDQFQFEQLVRLRLPLRLELRAAAAHRERRYDDTTRNAANQYAQLELRTRFGDVARLDLGYREERNTARVTRNVYRRRTATIDFVVNATHRDIVAIEVKGQRKAYPFRLTEIDVDDGPDVDVPRLDRRIQPEFTWEHAFGSRMKVRAEYEFDWRTSNDIEKRYRAHRATLALSQRIW